MGILLGLFNLRCHLTQTEIATFIGVIYQYDWHAEVTYYYCVVLFIFTHNICL